MHFDCAIKGSNPFTPKRKNRRKDREKMVFQSLVNLIRAYVSSLSEWFINYVVALGLVLSLGAGLVSYLVFGYSWFVGVYFVVFKILLGVHVLLSFLAVCKDYIYSHNILLICKGLVVLLVSRVVLLGIL